MLVLELESEDEYSPSLGPQTSAYSVSLSTKQISLRNILLKLATHYYWRLTILIERGNSVAEHYSSNIFRFTTVPKHCAYMNCNEGECDSETVMCKCHAGYRGEFCSESRLSKGATAEIVVGVIALLIIVLIISFYFIRKANFFGLRIPDLSKYMFLTPKNVIDSETRETSENIKYAIAHDKENNYNFAVKLLEWIGVTEADHSCRALVYAYEQNGESLPLLLRLIEYEVEQAKSNTVLFRNNSFASKCFKVYARFHSIYKAISAKVNEKFGQCVQHAISAFMFLRYFVAALAVPESFGILETAPDDILRRQCILISKVLSNLSTQVRFGEKEDYMMIMNDNIEMNENALDS